MQTLQRRLGVPGAAAIGIASMLGAGVFFVWAPATAAAGGWVVVALPLAATIAVLNALSTVRLAMRHPTSGGAYAFGRAELAPAAGFAAGVLFLLGKTASVGAIGLVAGGYLVPGFERPIAAGLIVVLAVLNATGVRTTAVVSAIAAGMVVAALLAVLTVGLVSGADAVEPLGAAGADGADGAGAGGILAAAGLIFFAFAGYARIATLAEEVRDPVRTLPRAAVVSIAVVLTLSGLTLAVLLSRLGADALAASSTPLIDLAGPAWAPVVAVAVTIACIGSMTGVLAGLSRTGLAMARDRELPGALAFVTSRTRAPIVAEAVLAALAVVAVLLLDTAAVVSVSACAVLFYYAIAHLAALRAGPSLGLPRGIPIAGLIGCVVVALATPLPALLAIVAVVGAAVAVRALVRRVRRA